MSETRFAFSARRRRVVQGLGAAPLLAALGTGWAQAPASGALHLGAAASLADVLAAVARDFQALKPGLQVEVSSGASGALVDRLSRGTAFDLIAAADADTITRGVERRLLVPDSVRTFASNGLVLVVPAGSTLNVQRLVDLAGANVQRIAIGRSATAPVGRFARQAIDASRLWPLLQARIVLAEHARDVLDRVMQGDVDAGIVYRSDAQHAGARVRVVQTLGGHAPIRATAAVAVGARQAALAGEFMQYLRTEAARAVLRRFGFDAP